MAGILTKGIKLSYKSTSTGSTYTDLNNLQSFPDLGGSKDTLEDTVMSSGSHTFTGGLENYGDGLGFGFLYEKTQFTTLNGLTGIQYWQITMPDGTTKATFTGECSVKLDGKGVNELLTYVLTITPNSNIVWS